MRKRSQPPGIAPDYGKSDRRDPLPTQISLNSGDFGKPLFLYGESSATFT
ncbi:MAG TPA: hypothetical protein VK211_11470 [Kamptonema sp.]|nr:hypothetical protein [Kamptonema sp.]